MTNMFHFKTDLQETLAVSYFTKPFSDEFNKFYNIVILLLILPLFIIKLKCKKHRL